MLRGDIAVLAKRINCSKKPKINLEKQPILCQTCKHLATMTTDKPASFLLFGCRLLKKKFGTEKDFFCGSGKSLKQEFKLHDVPIKCEKFEGLK